MKRIFVRGIWGVDKGFFEKHKDKTFDFLNKYDYDKTNCCATRRHELNTTIEQQINTIDKGKVVCYVYGEENYDYFKRFGIKTNLIFKEPYRHHPINENWRHKLEIMKMALEDYDEIVWIDWDCKRTKDIPEDFWDILGKKESFQACLVKYTHRQISWRNNKWNNKILPNGGFVYLRDKGIVDKLIELYDTKKTWTDEAPYAMYTDEIMGGFDKDKYFNLFEPLVASTRRSIFTEPKDKSCFYHR